MKFQTDGKTHVGCFVKWNAHLKFALILKGEVSLRVTMLR